MHAEADAGSPGRLQIFILDLTEKTSSTALLNSRGVKTPLVEWAHVAELHRKANVEHDSTKLEKMDYLQYCTWWTSSARGHQQHTAMQADARWKSEEADAAHPSGLMWVKDPASLELKQVTWVGVDTERAIIKETIKERSKEIKCVERSTRKPSQTTLSDMLKDLKATDFKKLALEDDMSFSFTAGRGKPRGTGGGKRGKTKTTKDPHAAWLEHQVVITKVIVDNKTALQRRRQMLTTHVQGLGVVLEQAEGLFGANLQEPPTIQTEGRPTALELLANLRYSSLALARTRMEIANMFLRQPDDLGENATVADEEQWIETTCGGLKALCEEDPHIKVLSPL